VDHPLQEIDLLKALAWCANHAATVRWEPLDGTDKVGVVLEAHGPNASEIRVLATTFEGAVIKARVAFEAMGAGSW
jgi:hypothetical protein